VEGRCPRRSRLAAVAAGILLLVAAGCGGSPREQTLVLQGTPVRPAGGTVSVVATPKGSSVAVFVTPRDIWPARFMPTAQPDGTKLVLLVDEQQDAWLQVLLPVRPNGSTGWVRRSDVDISRHDYRIEVSLGAHRLTVWKGTTVFLEDTVAVGAPATPTTTGRFYTTGLFETAKTKPMFGPYAFPLSGYSEVLYDYDGGEGQMGIHGTDDPATLGRNVSHGCIRMSNVAITRMAKALPIGVPVEIKP